MKPLPSILAIEPDPERAKALAHMVHDCVDAKVVVAACADVAVAVMGRRMPDVVLLSALAPPGEEQKLMAFLREAHDGSVPVLFVAPVVAARSKGALPLLRSLLGGRPAPAPELMRLGLSARLEAALQQIPRHANAPEERAVSVPRAHRWAAADVVWLSGVRLSRDVMGQLVNISNTGILIESDFALMPGNSVTFELCRGAADAPAVGHPSGLIVPAHIVRSEVSKVGPNALHYLVAARFSSDLELLPNALTGSAATDFSDPQDHATATNGHAPRQADQALHDLARALEGLESAIASMGAERQGELVEPDDRSACRERADASRNGTRQLTTGN